MKNKEDQLVTDHTLLDHITTLLTPIKNEYSTMIADKSIDDANLIDYIFQSTMSGLFAEVRLIQGSRLAKENTRICRKISKGFFLLVVERLMTSSRYPDILTDQLERDLSYVNFDMENYTTYHDEIGFDNYPIGYDEIEDGFHVYYVQFGGDNDYPICAIFYWGDNELRAYIPSDGNVWDKENRCACEGGLPDDMCDKEKMKKDILQNIKLS